MVSNATLYLIFAFKFYINNHIFLDMTAPKGVTIQMPCRAKGSPQPTITWLKDGHAMVSPR